MQSFFSNFIAKQLRLVLTFALAFSLGAASGGPENFELEEKEAEAKEWFYSREKERKSEPSDSNPWQEHNSSFEGKEVPIGEPQTLPDLVPIYLFNRCLLFYE